MDTDSFIVYIKTENISVDIAHDVQKDFILQIMKMKEHYLSENITKKL